MNIYEANDMLHKLHGLNVSVAIGEDTSTGILHGTDCFGLFSISNPPVKKDEVPVPPKVFRTKFIKSISGRNVITLEFPS